MKTHSITMIPIRELNPAAYNPRHMAPDEMEKLKRSLAEFGFVQPLVARRDDGLLIGGHQRLNAYKLLLQDRGHTEQDILMTLVPVMALDDIDDQRAMALNLALNKISGEWDYGKLGEVLQQLSGMPNIEVTGFSTDEVDNIVQLHADPILPHGVSEHTEENVQAAVETALVEKSLKFSFAVATPEEAEQVRTVLRAYGHSNPKNIGEAFVRVIRAAPAVEMPEADAAPETQRGAVTEAPPPRAKRGRKVKAPS